MSDINMTPLVDVMLVLVAILLITAPLLASRIALDLPQAQGTRQAAPDAAFVRISVQADGGYYWNLGSELDTEQRTDSAVSLEEMTSKVGALIAARGDTQVYIRADGHADYATVLAGMAALQKGGVSNLGLITEAPQ